MGSTKAALGVSIIVPAYNYAQFLSHAIDSALAQTHSPIEVIVVDDGSVDATAEVVAAYTDRRVRYLYQQNAGLSAARNTGIRNARYDFVSFLDADDMLMPNMCERIMETFSKLPAEFALIGCRMVKMSPDGTPIQSKQFGNQLGGELFPRHFVLKNRFPCNVIVRKSVFEVLGDFDTSLTSTEDRDMWIRISMAHRVFILGEFLVLIRRHATSMSRNSDRMKLNMRRVLRKAWHAGAHPRWSPFWLKVISYNHVEVAWMCYDEGRIAKALFHLLLSVALWPVFLDHGAISEPFLFRARSLARFLISGFGSRRGAIPALNGGGGNQNA
ncbi:MAG: glycosyltransferase family A protein [Verrucomicrobiota bacterium]